MKIVELKDKFDHQIHGNLSRTPLGQLRHKVGAFSHVVFIESEAGPSGCVRDSKGKCWDWWVGLEGNVVVIPSV